MPTPRRVQPQRHQAVRNLHRVGQQVVVQGRAVIQASRAKPNEIVVVVLAVLVGLLTASILMASLGVLGISLIVAAAALVLAMLAFSIWASRPPTSDLSLSYGALTTLLGLSGGAMIVSMLVGLGFRSQVGSLLAHGRASIGLAVPMPDGRKSAQRIRQKVRYNLQGQPWSEAENDVLRFNWLAMPIAAANGFIDELSVGCSDGLSVGVAASTSYGFNVRGGTEKSTDIEYLDVIFVPSGQDWKAYADIAEAGGFDVRLHVQEFQPRSEIWLRGALVGDFGPAPTCRIVLR